LTIETEVGSGVYSCVGEGMGKQGGRGGDKGWSEVWVQGVGEEEGYIGNTLCVIGIDCFW